MFLMDVFVYFILQHFYVQPNVQNFAKCNDVWPPIYWDYYSEVPYLLFNKHTLLLNSLDHYEPVTLFPQSLEVQNITNIYIFF